jgi:catechol 2,3-dioxygenase-like lactoylglutathione lyase family enzyme
MKHAIAHVALVVRDYDEAIAFYTQKLGFTLVEDTYQPEQDRRWVVVTPNRRPRTNDSRLRTHDSPRHLVMSWRVMGNG